MTERLKCRFCQAKFKMRLPKRNPDHVFTFDERIKMHMSLKHPEEYEKIYGDSEL